MFGDTRFGADDEGNGSLSLLYKQLIISTKTISTVH